MRLHRVLDQVLIPRDRHQLENHLPFGESISLVVSKGFFFFFNESEKNFWILAVRLLIIISDPNNNRNNNI